MKFIEMTGRTLKRVIAEEDVTAADLRHEGVTDDSVLRVNPQGDIELRRRDGWDVIGGLLGDWDRRVRGLTGLDWV